MMRRRYLLAAITLLFAAWLLAGCGGSTEPNNGGDLNIGVEFPGDTGDQASIVPSNAESVVISVLVPSSDCGCGVSESAAAPGDRIVPDTILNRPPGGGVASAVIRGIPPGSAGVRAVAYSQQNGQGAALAQAHTIVSIITQRTATARLTLVQIVDKIIATPSKLTMLIGEQAQITAEALDAAGATIIGAVLAYSSDATSVATVNSTGRVSAGALGNAVVTVRNPASGKQATVDVEVLEARVVRVDVSVNRPATVVGFPVQFTAQAIDDLGRVFTGAQFDWSAADPSLGTIDSQGSFDPLKGGTAVVTATEKSSGVPGNGQVVIAEWVVLLEWSAGEDMDLHLFDTVQTNHANYGNPAVPIGTLVGDSITAPGVEVFAGVITPDIPGTAAPEARYPVAVNYFRGQGDIQADVTFLAAGPTQTIETVSLSQANGDGGYPVTSPTSSWARPFDVVIGDGVALTDTANTNIQLGPPGSQLK